MTDKRDEKQDLKAERGKTKRPKYVVPTVADIITDRLTPVANAYWAPGQASYRPYDPQIIEQLWTEELLKTEIVSDRMIFLELSGYLESYLWKNFNPATATYAHVMSIVFLVNEKFRQNLLGVWDPFLKGTDFVPLFQRIVNIKSERKMGQREKTGYLIFLIHAFQSLENPLVRKCVLRLTSLPLWRALSPGMLQRQLKTFPDFKPMWKKELKTKKEPGVETTFLPQMLQEFFQTLQSVKPGSDFENKDIQRSIAYCEKFLEFVIDLLAQLPTRRFFHAVLLDTHFVVLCELSSLNNLAKPPPGVKVGKQKDGPGKLFNHLLALVKYYLFFEIDDQTGQALTDDDMISRHYMKLEHLQRVAFKFSDELRDLACSNIAVIDQREALTEHLNRLTTRQLRQLAERIGVLTPLQKELEGKIESRDLLIEIFCSVHERRPSQKQAVKEMPLYPPESILWDESLVPSENYTGEGCLALPKLNLQFLTFHDYLLRNFDLYRLESTYEIREDVANIIMRLRPRLGVNGRDTVFTGWARFAVPIYSFAITQVKKPNIGETKPALVKADITVDLSIFPPKVREEWEQIREHDVFFLITVQAQISVNEEREDVRWDENDPEFSWENLNRHTLGIQCVRGAEVFKVFDEDKKEVGAYDEDGKRHEGRGNIRTYQVELDCAQYQRDMSAHLSGEAKEDCYTTFNLLMRRNPKENNFKAVLGTIRDLMTTGCSVPDWMYDVFLGYGNPQAACYYNIPNQAKKVTFFDTFLDHDHLLDSFPEVDCVKPEGDHKTPFQYEIKFPQGKAPDFQQLQTLLPRSQRGPQATVKEAQKPSEKNGQEAQKAAQKGAKAAAKEAKKSAPDDSEQPKAAPAAEDSDSDNEGAPTDKLRVRAVVPPPVWGQVKRRRNNVRFTPMQVEAIKSGLHHGLTMVVGPPGTGKTDTAVQIVSELYKNFPEQRTLLVTHSNHALNDLFEKLMERDIDYRYMLRLGRGQEFLECDEDFSKFGRVNYMLGRRLKLLDEVAQLAKAFDMADDAAYTCETAGHFFLYHVLARWEQFKTQCKSLPRIVAPPPLPGPVSSVPVQDGAADGEKSDNNEGPGAQPMSDDGEPKAAPKEAESVVDLYPELKVVKDSFPFTKYFEGRDPDFHFKARSVEEDIALAESCFRCIEAIFIELEETRPFELLRTGVDRGNYLLTKHAKVIAMTCTHAAIQRSKFLELSFQYDNLVMEEAAQILDIETFIPMVLQSQDTEFGNRLKRVILLGDHHQLPPVVKNRAFQRYSHLDQSLFTRFVRLGMPYVQLNAQGRMRPSLAQLWNWRYENLRNLENVTVQPRFQLGNAGFRHDFQFINVEDYQGHGESTPQPYFYQNLGEAEYVVAVYMYMRLVGYPAEKISIITSYNGQKDLIKDVAWARCGNDPLYGMPAKIATVDKFQGQQNDFVLLSLVRTKTFGHIRDIRRLVVAMSRARLGLYVFGRLSLFQNCYELIKSFTPLTTKPARLEIIPTERTQDGIVNTRSVNSDVPARVVEDVTDMGQIVVELAAEVQKEWMAYQLRVQAFEAEKRRKEAEKERRAQEAQWLRDEAARKEAEENKRIERLKAAENESVLLQEQVNREKEEEEEDEE